jgi:hypothetical protein
VRKGSIIERESTNKFFETKEQEQLFAKNDKVES